MGSYWYNDKPREISLNHVNFLNKSVSSQFYQCTNRNQEAQLRNIGVYVLNDSQQVMFRVEACSSSLVSLFDYLEAFEFNCYLNQSLGSVDLLLKRHQVNPLVTALDQVEPLDPLQFKEFLNRFGTPSFGKKRTPKISTTTLTPSYQQAISKPTHCKDSHVLRTHCKDSHVLRTPDFYRYSKP